MGRVAHQKSAKQANPSNGTRGAKIAKQRKNHKVVIESETQENKEKSRAVLSFRAEPPPGYTFIPAGNPQLTSALKEFAKKGNHQILAVTTTPHASRHELSREVHRIGFHFPTEVVSQVCNHYGIRLTSGGKLVEEKDDDKLFMRLYQKGQLALDEEVRDQVTINTEAKQIIQDLFPHIPDNDLFQIIKTAFQLGDGKVGTADEIPLVRRAQLSVVAHIRHTYTSYDKLLRAVPYSEARHRVESITLQKLIDWRGDGQDDKQAMDDTLREVVVISDEEESDGEIEEGQVLEGRHLQVQPVNGGTRSNDIDHGRPRSPVEMQSDEEAPRGYRYLPQVVRRVAVQDSQAISVARQQSRYAVWDRIRQEYRSEVAPTQPRVVERVLLDEPQAVTAQVTYVTREPIYVPDPPLHRVMEPAARIVSNPSPPTYVRGADGKLYERITSYSESIAPAAPPRRLYTPPPTEYQRQYVDSRQASPRLQPLQIHQRTGSLGNNDGTVLPSIESPGGAQPFSATRRNLFEDSRPILSKRNSGAYDSNQRQAAVIDFGSSAEQAGKRRRLEGTPPSPYLVRQPERGQDDPIRGGVRPATTQQYVEDVHPPQQQRLIPLDNPGATSARQQVYDRPDPRMQPAIVYREEVLNRDFPSPRATDPRAMPSQGVREPYYMHSPRRIEYVNDYDRPATRPYGDPVRHYISDEPINGASDRIGRVVLDDIPLQRQPLNHGSEYVTRYVRSDARNPFEGPGETQYYIQDLPSDSVQREYYPMSGHALLPQHRDAARSQYMAKQQRRVTQPQVMHPRATQPPKIVHRDA